MIYIVLDNYWKFFNIDIEKSLYKIAEKNNMSLKVLRIGYQNNIFIEAVRRFAYKIGLKTFLLKYKEMKKVQFLPEDYVIYFDIFREDKLEVLRNFTKNSKEIFWLWNKMEASKIEYLKTFSKNIWTFDKVDSEINNIKYSPQFYWRSNSKTLNSKIDILFLGQNKGRDLQIIELDRKLKLNNKFIIVLKKYKSEVFKILSKNKKYYTYKITPYSKVIELIKQSNCLLELTQKNQEGLTIRALEALFFNKKLITNNIEIKKYNFYNKNNIFIIDDFFNINEKDIDEIKKFLKEEYIEISKAIKSQYSIESWLTTLLNNYIK